jgi:putative transcriptional regulator
MAVFGLKEKSQTGDPVMRALPCALATPHRSVHVWGVIGHEPMTDLTGRLLIAMPGMPDPRFEHSLIYVCAHSEDGSMGLIVNKPSADVTFQALIDQLSIENTGDLTDIEVHFGGPVELGRGFVLHSTDFQSEMTTLFVDDDFAMTATLDVLENIASGGGPEKRLIVLGYAGWGPGQLEEEIMQNGWLICDASRDIVFDRADVDKWEAALGTLGVSPLALSSEGGRA